MKYELFFFKVNDRNLDINALFEYFEQQDYFNIVFEEQLACIKYHNPLLMLDFVFNLTKVSRVPDVHRLNPKFLDLDFYLSVDSMMPLFKMNFIASIIDKLCSRFDLYIYNYMFNDVSSFNNNLILKSYEKHRGIYQLKYPLEYNCLTYVDNEKLNGYFRYIVDANTIKDYYKNQYVFLPTNFVYDSRFNKTYLTASIDLEHASIIPPFTDLLYIKMNDKNHVYKYSDVLSIIGKYLKDLPGFIANTKVLDLKFVKKVKKILVKAKLKEVDCDLALIEMENLIDF